MTIPRYARSSPENRRLSALAIVTVTCGLTPLARADDDQGASRRALLDVRREALALEERGEWVEACPMLERVAAGSPEAIAPKLELGRCWAEAGRTATAQQHFHRAAELAKERGDERATLAESKAAALEHRIPKLRLVLGDGAQKPGPQPVIVWSSTSKSTAQRSAISSLIDQHGPSPRGVRR